MLLPLLMNLGMLGGGGEATTEDIWWRRARKARAGTYLILTDAQKKEKKRLFRQFSRPNGT